MYYICFFKLRSSQIQSLSLGTKCKCYCRLLTIWDKIVAEVNHSRICTIINILCSCVPPPPKLLYWSHTIMSAESDDKSLPNGRTYGFSKYRNYYSLSDQGMNNYQCFSSYTCHRIRRWFVLNDKAIYEWNWVTVYGMWNSIPTGYKSWSSLTKVGTFCPSRLKRRLYVRI